MDDNKTHELLRAILEELRTFSGHTRDSIVIFLMLMGIQTIVLGFILWRSW